ncbi:AtpZ/AtpI family protein [Desertimonas flava]|nr:AtpZ/AtpI family protein [Desertimonas flava]
MQPRAGASSDSLGRGMDAVITLVVFLGIGWLLDRWLGTTPWFMIGLFLLAGVGTFIIMKARYTATMEALEAERRSAATAQRTASPTQDDPVGATPEAAAS